MGKLEDAVDQYLEALKNDLMTKTRSTASSSCQEIRRRMNGQQKRQQEQKIGKTAGSETTERTAREKRPTATVGPAKDQSKQTPRPARDKRATETGTGQRAIAANPSTERVTLAVQKKVSRADVTGRGPREHEPKTCSAGSTQ
jgi:hypothetical protein